MGQPPFSCERGYTAPDAGGWSADYLQKPPKTGFLSLTFPSLKGIENALGVGADNGIRRVQILIAKPRCKLAANVGNGLRLEVTAIVASANFQSRQFPIGSRWPPTFICVGRGQGSFLLWLIIPDHGFKVVRPNVDVPRGKPFFHVVIVPRGKFFCDYGVAEPTRAIFPFVRRTVRYSQFRKLQRSVAGAAPTGPALPCLDGFDELLPMPGLDWIAMDFVLEVVEVLVFAPAVVTARDQRTLAKQGQDGVLRSSDAFHSQAICYRIQILSRMKRHSVRVAAPPIPSAQYVHRQSGGIDKFAHSNADGRDCDPTRQASYTASRSGKGTMFAPFLNWSR